MRAGPAMVIQLLLVVCVSTSSLRDGAKTVYVIRHGTAEHNVRYFTCKKEYAWLIDERCAGKDDLCKETRTLFPEIEECAYMTNATVDTALVPDGVREAELLGVEWARGAAMLFNESGNTHVAAAMRPCDVELVVVSPLKRTLQTFEHVCGATSTHTCQSLIEEQIASRTDAETEAREHVCGATSTHTCQSLIEEQIASRTDAETEAREHVFGATSTHTYQSLIGEQIASRTDAETEHVFGATSTHTRSHTPARGGRHTLALDVIKEWSEGKHTPNRRASRSALQQHHPLVDFSLLESDEDEMWQAYWPGTGDGLEPLKNLESRADLFRRWLCARTEQNIVVVSHGTFLGNLLYGAFINGDVELAHAQLYAYPLHCS
eukprot:NODE_9494_length_1420_cov_19.171694.p1 GENE.NODE_9494_length_1420_cov_19.171694~~NODE_9494_length_1420_cov_19.171694.p1  ORF type:complete len:377 (-),score=71.15 NODE_9494_length_1420_cov_19.171694:188-1318(-)